MTWLPISLKNAAKCDKWYQLQNLSITESLNANGTWKKALVVQLQVYHDLSVEQKPKIKKTLYSLVFSEAVKFCRAKQILCLAKINFSKILFCRCSGSPKQFCTCLCKCDNELKTASFFSTFTVGKKSCASFWKQKIKNKTTKTTVFLVFIFKPKLLFFTL